MFKYNIYFHFISKSNALDNYDNNELTIFVNDIEELYSFLNGQIEILIATFPSIPADFRVFFLAVESEGFYFEPFSGR